MKLRETTFGPAGRSLARVWVLSALVLLVIMGGFPAPGNAAPDKPFRIGVLSSGWGPTPQSVGLQQGLKELGYVENVDYILGIRFTQGKSTELPQAARDLLKYGVDLIFCTNTSAAMAAKEATSTVPIVFSNTADPVGNGLIASYARPGGNITGLTDLNVELSARRLQMFLKIFPAMKRVLFVYDVNDKADKNLGGAYAKAAKVLGITLLIKSVNNQKEAGKVILASRKVNVQGIIGTRNTNLNISGFMLEVAARRNIPTMFGSTFMVEEGGFASYGPSWFEAGRLAARIVDKIVKGANPGEIPVEVNTKLEFAINLKEANRMGLKINPEVLYLADRIIR